MPYKNLIKRKEYAKEYRKNHRKEFRKYSKKYRGKNLKEIREKDKDYSAKFRENNPEKTRQMCREWNNVHKKYIKQRNQIYIKTEKGKRAKIKSQNKHKKGLGFILMFLNPFDDSTLVDYHHITDAYVVAIPRELHQLYRGINHRENLMSIIKQIY